MQVQTILFHSLAALMAAYDELIEHARVAASILVAEIDAAFSLIEDTGVRAAGPAQRPHCTCGITWAQADWDGTVDDGYVRPLGFLIPHA